MYYLKCTVLSLPHSKNGSDISWLTFLSKASPCLFFSFPCLNLLLWMYLSALPLLPLASAISSNNDLILRSVPKLKCGKNLQLAERLACCRWTFLYKAVFFFVHEVRWNLIQEFSLSDVFFFFFNFSDFLTWTWHLDSYFLFEGYKYLCLDFFLFYVSSNFLLNAHSKI